MAVKVKSLSGVQTSSAGSLHGDLLYQLETDILSGKFKRGHKLTEQVICEKYDVSRTPVREAFLQLEMAGLIEIIPNRGAFVLGLSERDIEDVRLLRSIFEVQAIKWAIQRITKEELEQLEENFEFMEFYTMKEDMAKMLNINSNFHGMIYTATHNHMLEQLLSHFQAYLTTNDSSKRNSKFLPEILEEHRKIFQAFMDRDPEAGAKAMEEHMSNSVIRKSE